MPKIFITPIIKVKVAADISIYVPIPIKFKNLVFPEILRGADTSNRRSQTLKNWIKSISIFFGMPIRLHNRGMQLTIPMLYAENGYNNENTEED